MQSDRDEGGEQASRQQPIRAAAAYRASFNNREIAMKLVKISLAGAAALIISSVAWAQQGLTGTITQIDRIHGTVTIERTQGGTVGANAGGAAEQFKAQDGLALDAVHAGDRVAFSATEADGIKTITKLQRQ
jgi:Cu/Ag efflux protein CusF